MSRPGDPHPNADVRMRGFRERATVESALEWLDAQLPQSDLDRDGPPSVGLSRDSRPRESVSITDAAGRVLAEDVVSRVDVPQFRRAMMDGYAVRADDTHGASTYNRLPLEVIGVCLPGAPSDQQVEPGSAMPIMTGALLPAGADAVLPAEIAELRDQRVLALDAVAEGKHVGAVGEDVRAGETVLAAGRLLRPQDVGLLSSIGVATVSVIARPRVRIVVTGNELLPPGSTPHGCQIADANGPMLAALVERDGGRVDNPGIVPDDREAITDALQTEADVVLVSGGSSVGQEDHVPTLLAQQGELAIHGIAMRPSSPTGMGRLQGRLVFLLPGNPTSCLCAYDFFAGRAIRALGGRPREWPYRSIVAPLARKLVSTVGRVDYARVRFLAGKIEPLAIGGASVLSSTTRADGFVIIPADSEGFGEGSTVTAQLYD